MKIDMNKDYVITINREVGSGGRTVGRMLAQRLGVPFYDKALINALTFGPYTISEDTYRSTWNWNEWPGAMIQTEVFAN
jgi:cytidylate kinase